MSSQGEIPEEDRWLLEEAHFELMYWDDQHGLVYRQELVFILCVFWTLAWFIIASGIKLVYRKLEEEQKYMALGGHHHSDHHDHDHHHHHHHHHHDRHGTHHSHHHHHHHHRRNPEHDNVHSAVTNALTTAGLTTCASERSLGGDDVPARSVALAATYAATYGPRTSNQSTSSNDAGKSKKLTQFDRPVYTQSRKKLMMSTYQRSLSGINAISTSKVVKRISGFLSPNGYKTVPAHLAQPYRKPRMLRYYRVKIQREGVFCVVAVVASVVCLTAVALSNRPLEKFLLAYSSGHQMLFCMAIGHWIASVFEDVILRWFGWLDACYELEHEEDFFCSKWPSQCCRSFRCTLHLDRLMGHLGALFTYAYILVFQRMGGLGVQGFLFELPNILDIYRKVDYAKDCPPPWISSPASTRKHWQYVLIMFVLSRGLAMSFYIYTLIPGSRGAKIIQDHLQDVDRTVYYALAGVATARGIRILVNMVRLMRADEQRAQVWREQDAELASKLQKFQQATTNFAKAGSYNRDGFDSRPTSPHSRSRLSADHSRPNRDGSNWGGLDSRPTSPYSRSRLSTDHSFNRSRRSTDALGAGLGGRSSIRKSVSIASEDA